MERLAARQPVMKYFYRYPCGAAALWYDARLCMISDLGARKDVRVAREVLQSGHFPQRILVCPALHLSQLVQVELLRG